MKRPTTWAERTIRRFRWMLAAVTVLFLVTDLVAWWGVAPPLKPLSLPEITGNILFAIGFGCPLALHLSGLPGWRETIGTLLVGALLGIALGILQAFTAAQVIVGLGAASIMILGWRAYSHRGEERTRALLFLLPGLVSLLFTFEAGIHFDLVSSVMPETFDGAAYLVDGSFGVQLAFATGRLFRAAPWLAFVCFAIYVAPPPSLVFVYALEVSGRRRPPVDVVTVLLAIAVVGYLMYFVCPVAGPLAAFPDQYPETPPPTIESSRLRVPFVQPDGTPAPRNGMPSLHFASVLIAYWHARPYGKIASLVAATFVVGTFLATLGLGEHYFVDLVVAFPFTLFMQALCTPGEPRLRRAKWRALAGSVGLVMAWYAILFAGVELVQHYPALLWMLALLTAGGVWLLERDLYRSGMDDAEPPHETRAPGPPGTFFGGHVKEFRDDALALLTESQRSHGDVVRFRLGAMVVHLIAHPDHIKHVLVGNARNFTKETRSSAKIRGLTGESLLTSNGDFWLEQRRLMQPAFQPGRLAPFVPMMARTTQAMLDRWSASTEPIDVASEMMRLTYRIVAGVLFGADVEPEIDRIENATAVVMSHTWARLEHVVELPLWAPTPGNRRFRHALRQIDDVVDRILNRSGAHDPLVPNLLSRLLHHRGRPNGEGMSERQLRNETISLLLAGHETTANALAWTLHLLSQQPAAAEKLRREATIVLGDREPTFDDLTRLPETTKAFQEAMRLYPPIWIMERHVVADDEISGYLIPAKSTVVISPFVTHRHPDFWDEPLAFRPDRFDAKWAGDRKPFSYIPFGGGQRLCIGKELAMMEAAVILPMIVRAFDLTPTTLEAEPNPGITLRVRGGLRMRVSLVAD